MNSNDITRLRCPVLAALALMLREAEYIVAVPDGANLSYGCEFYVDSEDGLDSVVVAILENGCWLVDSLAADLSSSSQSAWLVRGEAVIDPAHPDAVEMVEEAIRRAFCE